MNYRADFVCFDSILVELKSLERLTKRETAQVVHYLAASTIPVGLLLNFGAPRLQYRRFVGPSNRNDEPGSLRLSMVPTDVTDGRS